MRGAVMYGPGDVRIEERDDPKIVAGYQTACVNREPVGAGGTQAEYARIPLADGTL